MPASRLPIVCLLFVLLTCVHLDAQPPVPAPAPLPSLASLQSPGIRVKDITSMAGARDNQLYGLGLVVGLDRTGARSLSTQRMAIDMLRKMDVTTQLARQNLQDNVFFSRSISAVMVTANLHPFSREGSRLDVNVSVLDDAISLQGGTLLMTPLKGADGEVYAVAQGPVSIGGMQNQFGGFGQVRNHTTSGNISGGAIVEREELGNIFEGRSVKLLLREPDFSTANLIANRIADRFGTQSVAIDPGTVHVTIPSKRLNNPIGFVGELGLLEIQPDASAKVIISERTGTVVVGNHVRISAVAIAHGNLVIQPAPLVTPPGAAAPPFAGFAPPLLPGQVPPGDKVNVVTPTVTVAELSQALNALGVTPKDLIAIFQTLKQSGALHAELVVM